MLRFVATSELGRLARWLRLLGYDVALYPTNDPIGLLSLAIRERRVLLTRQRRFDPATLVRFVQVRAETIGPQLQQLKRMRLIAGRTKRWFERCSLCNAILQAVPKRRLQGKVPAFTYRVQERFYQCPRCRRIYWPGSHMGRVQAFVAKLKR